LQLTEAMRVHVVMSRLALALFAMGLAFVGFAAPRACPSIYPGGAPRAQMLWDVGGPDASVLLVGTYHAASDDDLSDAARAAIASADGLAVSRR